MKYYTGARTDWKANIANHVHKTFRGKLARAATPFNWQTDPITIQKRLDTIGIIVIKNQFQSFSCSGQAGSYLLGILLAIKNTTKYIAVSAKSIYSLIFYPNGGGATDADLINQICNVGATPEAVVSSYKADGTTDEPFITDTSWYTAPNKIIESADAGWVSVNVANDIDSVAEAILIYGAVIARIQGNFTSEEWGGAYPKMPVVTPTEAHYLCFFNAQMKGGVKTLYALESWGTGVGDNGVQYFIGGGYIGSKYIKSWFAFAPKYVPHPTIPNQTLPNPAIIPWQTRLFNYFFALFSGIFK